MIQFKQFYILKGNDFIKTELINIKANDKFTFSDNNILDKNLYKASCDGYIVDEEKNIQAIYARDKVIDGRKLRSWINLNKNIEKKRKSLKNNRRKGVC